MILHLLKRVRLHPPQPGLLPRYTSSSQTNTQLTRENGYTILTMKNPSANILSTSFMTELMERIQSVEDSESQGLILTSASSNIFCPGLDLIELVGCGEEATKSYYSLFQDLWFKLYKTRLVTIAAVNGHAVAAGCGLVMACDYRILAQGSYKFGIHSAKLGIPMPYYLLEVLQNAAGWKRGETTAMQAKIFSPDEALSLGFVDRLSSVDSVLDEAREEMTSFLKTDHRARTVSKMDSRHDLISKFELLKQEDIRKLTNSLHSKETRKILKDHIEKMKSTKKPT